MKFAALIIEALGILAVGCGIAIEVIYKAAAGLLCITSGSFLLVIGGFIWAKVMPRSGSRDNADNPGASTG